MEIHKPKWRRNLDRSYFDGAQHPSCYGVWRSQDTIQFWPLAASMLSMSLRDPVVVLRVVAQACQLSPSRAKL